MRHFFPFALVSLLATLACGSSSSPTAPGGTTSTTPTTSHGTFSATINGVAWNATFITQPLRITGPAGTALTLSGTDFVNQVTLTMSPLFSTGTYPIGPSVATSASFQNSTGIWEANNSTGIGSIILTAITPAGSSSAFAAAGTFAFTLAPATAASGATGTKVVTNGAFNISF